MARNNEKNPLTNPLHKKPLERDEIDEVIEVVARFVSPGADIEILRASPFYQPVRERVAILIGGRKKK
ncbi:MAG: hypothetical protein V1934_02830 [Methanobacteriota archaeon]